MIDSGEQPHHPIIVILGPTATGKTKLAVHVAGTINGEVVSADSRQVYRSMDIGTGKDLNEYSWRGKQISYHLIDIRDAGDIYTVYDFRNDFDQVAHDINAREHKIVLCGGTGMYLDAVIRNYDLPEAKENQQVRSKWSARSDEDLKRELATLKPLHNTTDVLDRDRLERALEVAHAETQTTTSRTVYSTMVFGIQMERTLVRERIKSRLEQRLETGMIEEVELLLEQGVTLERLKYYGLEYKFIGMYLNGELNRNDMIQKLNSAISAFAKRQMTWYRRMEKHGINIHWIDGMKDTKDQVEEVLKTLPQS